MIRVYFFCNLGELSENQKQEMEKHREKLILKEKEIEGLRQQMVKLSKIIDKQKDEIKVLQKQLRSALCFRICWYSYVPNSALTHLLVFVCWWFCFECIDDFTNELHLYTVSNKNKSSQNKLLFDSKNYLYNLQRGWSHSYMNRLWTYTAFLITNCVK